MQAENVSSPSSCCLSKQALLESIQLLNPLLRSSSQLADLARSVQIRIAYSLLHSPQYNLDESQVYELLQLTSSSQRRNALLAGLPSALVSTRSHR